MPRSAGLRPTAPPEVKLLGGEDAALCLAGPLPSNAKAVPFIAALATGGEGGQSCSTPSSFP